MAPRESCAVNHSALAATYCRRQQRARGHQEAAACRMDPPRMEFPGGKTLQLLAGASDLPRPLVSSVPQLGECQPVDWAVSVAQTWPPRACPRGARHASGSQRPVDVLGPDAVGWRHCLPTAPSFCFSGGEGGDAFLSQKKFIDGGRK